MSFNLNLKNMLDILFSIKDPHEKRSSNATLNSNDFNVTQSLYHKSLGIILDGQLLLQEQLKQVKFDLRTEIKGFLFNQLLITLLF